MMGGDDEETGLSRYDNLPFETVSRYINLSDGAGGFARLPVPYGLGQVAWTASQAIDRVSRGLMDPGEAGGHVLLSFFKQVMPDAYPAYKFTDDPIPWIMQTFLPQPVRPFVDTAVNKDYWGTPINHGNPAVGVRDFESGRKTTAGVWHKMARVMHDLTPFDVSPESLRYVFNYHLSGPFQGIMVALESNRLNDQIYKPTRDVLGSVLTALGGISVWSAPTNVAQSYYYGQKREIEDLLTERGVRVSSPNNKDSAQKTKFIRKSMTEAGLEPALIDSYLAIVDADRELGKLDRNLSNKYRDQKFASIDESGLKDDFDQWNQDKQKILVEASRRINAYRNESTA
jgi:hypothetical protein